MKRLLLLLSFLIASPAMACSEVEIQSQKIAAVANNICQLGNKGIIDKSIAKEMYAEILEKLKKDYKANSSLSKERLTRVFTLLDLNCEL